MNQELIDRVAWVGRGDLNGPITGVVLRFAGLGGTSGMKTGCDDHELEWANAGGLIVFPYHSPWAWMNPETVSFVDELVDALIDSVAGGDETLPLIATGGSMGGHAALAYALNSRHIVARALAISPATDLTFHYIERPDLPRTLHAAYGSYDDITDALAANSPSLRAADMPDIPYLVVQGDNDLAVSKVRHADVFVANMRAAGHRRVEYRELFGVGHGGPFDFRTNQAIKRFVLDGLRAR